MDDDPARSDAIADVINLLAAPIAGGIRSIEQFRRGSDELLRAIDNLNTTMENLNATATRVNNLVADIEGPIRAMMPQLTRSVQAADEMSKLLEAPVRAAAPNLERVVEALSSPGFATLPNQLGDFMGTLSEVSKRLGPLTSFAENAGGLFGGFKMPGTGTQRSTSPAQSEPSTVHMTRISAEDAASTKKTTAKKTPAKKTPAKKTTAKKKSSAKKAGG
jgi:hypothetical protein